MSATYHYKSVLRPIKSVIRNPLCLPFLKVCVTVSWVWCTSSVIKCVISKRRPDARVLMSRQWQRLLTNWWSPTSCPSNTLTRCDKHTIHNGAPSDTTDADAKVQRVVAPISDQVDREADVSFEKRSDVDLLYMCVCIYYICAFVRSCIQMQSCLSEWRTAC